MLMVFFMDPVEFRMVEECMWPVEGEILHEQAEE